jgi:hypothetical protein
MLRFVIAYALMRARKIVRGLKERSSEDERFAAADHVVARLKERGDSLRLDEEMNPAPELST